MAPTTLRIALDWTPNTIHSGLYLAQSQGFYNKHNLQIELVAPDPEYTKTPAKRLEAGDVDLAICPSESCIAYNEGGKMRLQAIYAILQEDASAIVAKKEVSRIGELKNEKKYGSYNARYEDAIVAAMVEKDGGQGAGMEIERSQGKLSMFDALKEGKVDATWIFLPWEGVEAEMEGVEMKYFKLEDSNIPYGYSPVIARNADKCPSDDVLKAFVAATREGYEYAMNNPEDAAAVLEGEAIPRRSKEFLQKSQESINEYYSDGHPLGYMDQAKWTAWLSWLKANDLLTGPEEIKEENIFTNQFAGNLYDIKYLLPYLKTNTLKPPSAFAALPKDIKFSMREHFDNMAPMYDEFGQIFYFLAQKLFDLNPDPITSSSIIHDNGNGNGVISSVLLRNTTETPTIHATDLSPEMIKETKKRAGLESVKAEEMDSEALNFSDGTFTHSFTNMLHPTSLRPDLVTSEIYRTLKPGGVALASQFTSYGWIPIADAAIHKLRPDAPTFLGPVPEEWKKPAWFKGLFVEAGF